MTSLTKTEDYLFIEAITLRKKKAIELSESFIGDFDYQKSVEQISNSILKDVLDRLPFNRCVESLSFSLLITDVVVSEILLSARSLIEKIILVSNVVELGGREFINPYNISQKEENLSAAKNYGFFFTPLSLGQKMASFANGAKNIKSALDPACGVGTLLAALLIANPQIKHLVGYEIDSFTANIARKLLSTVCASLGISPTIEIKQLDFLEFVSNLNWDDEHNEKFDYIIMNPPYGRVRFLRTNLTNKETISNLDDLEKNKLESRLRNESQKNALGFRKRFSEIGLGKGTPEYSKLFLGAALLLASKNGCIVSITPSSWLADQDGKGLRQYLLARHGIAQIWNFNETSKLFKTVNQPTSVVFIYANKKQEQIKIQNNLKSVDDIDFKIEILDAENIQKFSPDWLRIPRFGNSHAILLEKIHQNKSLIEITNLVNLRGELDLTVNKDLLSHDTSLVRLVRGDHVKKFCFLDTKSSKKEGYVDYKYFIERLGKSVKSEYVHRWRIVLPQCVYMQKKKRIEACIVPPDHVVSNSCNFILLKNPGKQELDDLSIICAILNSLVIEWRFRMFNSNNHVANYELDELPLVEISNIPREVKTELVQTIYRFTQYGNSEDEVIIEAIIANLYQLDSSDLELIFQNVDCEYKSALMKSVSNVYEIE